MAIVRAPLQGRVLALDDVADDVFAQRMMGEGLALVPGSTRASAPIDGVVAKLFRGGHAFVVQSDDGLEVLVHLGLETVHRAGEGFETHVAEGDRVAAGEPVVSMDLDALRADGIDMTTPVIVISGHTITWQADETIEEGDALLTVDL